MSNKQEGDYRFGDYRLAATERVLRRNGEIVPLPLKSLEVLLALVDQQGRVVSKAELMEQVWPDSHVEEANLARHIYTLRKTLGDQAGGEHQYILTVPGRGYRFVMDVQTEIPAIGESDGPLIVREDAAPPHPFRSGLRLKYRLLIALVGLVALSAIVLLAALIIGGRARINESPPDPIIVRLPNTGNLVDGLVSPDGKYIVKIVKEKRQQSLWLQVSADGSETQIVPPSTLRLGCLAFSPDSKFVYYTTRKPDQTETLYQIPITGGNARRIVERLNSTVSFAPDGRQFAFVREDHVRGRSSLLIATLDGSEEKILAARETPEYLDYPAWSPDGNRIVCVYNTTSRSQLLEINLKNHSERILSTPSWKFIRRPSWLKHGGGLVVAADEGFNLRHAWLLPLSEDGTRLPRRLTTGVQMWRGVSLTDDAHDLVCIERIRFADVWVSSAVTPNRTAQITSGGGNYEGLSWTPDGRLLYSSDTNGFWNILVMNADGKGQRQLTTGTYDNILPSMSPDNRYIFFTSTRNGAANIWRMDNDGSNPKQLTFGTGDLAPQCTPDGKWVVYTSASSKSAYTLKRVPVEGGVPELLGLENGGEAVVSPDGNYLAYLKAEAKSSASVMPTMLTLISLTDGTIRHLGGVSARPADSGGARLRWMPDGKSIVYTDRVGGSENLWKQPVAGGPPQQLTNFSGDGIFGFDISSKGNLAILRGPVKYQLVRIKYPNVKLGFR